MRECWNTPVMQSQNQPWNPENIMPEVIRKSAVTKILWFHFQNVSLLDRNQTLLRITFWKGLTIYSRTRRLKRPKLLWIYQIFSEKSTCRRQGANQCFKANFDLVVTDRYHHRCIDSGLLQDRVLEISRFSKKNLSDPVLFQILSKSEASGSS